MHAIFLFIRFLQLFLWLAFNFIFKVIQYFIWELTGVAATRRDATKKNPDSKISAQVLKIRGKFKFCDYVMGASKWDFLLTHERFEPPEYVLQDHITLYAVTEKEAIFVEAPHGIKVWNTEQHPPFLMAAQYHAAIKVIAMPVESLNYLSDKVGGPKGKLIFVGNPARCGSTLVVRLFEATDRIVAFGEPNCLNLLAQLNDIQQRKKELGDDFDRLVISTIRILCKPTESGEEIGYLIKLCSPAMTAMPLLMKLFPNSSYLYLYRNPVKVAQSLYRLSYTLYSLKLIYFFGKNSAERMATCFSAMGMPSSPYRFKCQHDLSVGILNWCVLTRQFLDFRKASLDIAAVRYEDIIQNAVEAMTKILKYCELSVELAEKSTEAMSRDSQEGTPISIDILKKFPLLPCAGEAKIECEKIMKNFGFPSLDEAYIADFTITL